jgi:hypothetical protein
LFVLLFALNYLRKPIKHQAAEHCEEKALKEISSPYRSFRVSGSSQNGPDKANNSVSYSAVDEQFFPM